MSITKELFNKLLEREELTLEFISRKDLESFMSNLRVYSHRYKKTFKELDMEEFDLLNKLVISYDVLSETPISVVAKITTRPAKIKHSISFKIL